jgi:hypothetical protein
MYFKSLLILISTICHDMLVEGLQAAMLELPTEKRGQTANDSSM